MIVYVGSGPVNPRTFREFVASLGHGQMVSRQTGAFRLPKAGRWAFDNGAWTDFKNGVPFNDQQFMWRVRRLMELPDDRLPDWCICPDAVGQEQSLQYSLEWKSVLAETAPRLKWYLAVQNFADPAQVAHALELERFEGLFVGGDNDQWRNATMPGWVEMAHQRKMPLHIGRVNGGPRLQWAVNVGADSVDGTGWVKAGERWAHYLIDLPKPTVELMPEDKEIREEWIAFGQFLLETYPSLEAWKERMPEDLAEDAHWERWRRIDAMTPKEFAYWMAISYPGFAGSQDMLLEEGRSMTPEEFNDWKQALTYEGERFLGPKAVPPEPVVPGLED